MRCTRQPPSPGGRFHQRHRLDRPRRCEGHSQSLRVLALHHRPHPFLPCERQLAATTPLPDQLLRGSPHRWPKPNAHQEQNPEKRRRLAFPAEITDVCNVRLLLPCRDHRGGYRRRRKSRHMRLQMFKECRPMLTPWHRKRKRRPAFERRQLRWKPTTAVRPKLRIGKR